MGSIILTEIVSTGWDLATKPKVRKEAVAGFVAIKDQVIDEPSSLFPILKEVVLEEATGLTSENLDELDIATARGQHLTTKATIRTVVTVFAGGRFIIHLPKMADDLAAKMLDAKLIAKFRKAKGFDKNLLTVFKKDLNELLEIMPEVTESITKISDFASAQELTELVAKMNRLKEVPGLGKVITDMATQWNKFHGGQFVLDYFSSKIDNLGGRLRFEVKETIKNPNGDAVARVYDGFLEKGGKVTKYELKNWSGWYPSTIKTQFIRDLQGISNLEELKWVFNSTSGVNKGNIKGKILATLKKADGNAVDELESLFKKNQSFRNKVAGWIGDEGEVNSEDFLKWLSKDDNFDKIIEIAN